LEITPDLETFIFQGKVKIEFQIDSSKINHDNCNVITLHSKELCIASAYYTILEENTNALVGASSNIPADEICFNVKATTVKLVFSQGFTNANKIVLHIEYSGLINNEMSGFYRSSYTDITGQTKIMGSTQFESLDARRAFPCIDEPGKKAIFGVSFIVSNKLDVLSNMPEKLIQSINASTKRIVFLDTPIMSSYLVAFCIGEFDSIQGLTKRGILVRVYTPPGKSFQGDYALSAAIRCLDLYDEFFGSPFPLPKLDMIAIPEFAMGAMEVNIIVVVVFITSLCFFFILFFYSFFFPNTFGIHISRVSFDTFHKFYYIEK
jgi:aminopeptidase N